MNFCFLGVEPEKRCISSLGKSEIAGPAFEQSPAVLAVSVDDEYIPEALHPMVTAGLVRTEDITHIESTGHADIYQRPHVMSSELSIKWGQSAGGLPSAFDAHFFV